jgi:hypothetical protein
MKTKEHLQNGTRPSKKCTKENDTKRYLRVATLARDGLLVVKGHGGPFSPTEDRILIPREIVPGLLTAIHIKTDHPTPHQLKQVFHRSFSCLDAERYIKENCDNCHTCASLKTLPKHINEFSKSDPCDHVGQEYASDVMRRAGQCILVSREGVSSYTTAVMIPSERAEHLLDGVIQTVLPLHPIDGPSSSIRVDPAPGFQHLEKTQPLNIYGIEFQLGRVKNPNKNSIADKAIQELESEIMRIEPSGGRISNRQLTFALQRLNSRIRLHGLSAYELMFRRSQYTASTIDNHDSDIISSQHSSRLSNHLPSFNSQQPKSAPRSRHTDYTPIEGSIIYLKNDKSKHMARERYIVTKMDGEWLTIQKLLRGRFGSKRYKVHISECFTVPAIRSSNHNNHITSSEDEDYPDPDHDQPLNAPTVQPHTIDRTPAVRDSPSAIPVPCFPEDTTPPGPPAPTPPAARRYPLRIRKPPSLLLNEIAPNFFEGEIEAEEEEEVATP